MENNRGRNISTHTQSLVNGKRKSVHIDTLETEKNYLRMISWINDHLLTHKITTLKIKVDSTVDLFHDYSLRGVNGQKFMRDSRVPVNDTVQCRDTKLVGFCCSILKS